MMNRSTVKALVASAALGTALGVAGIMTSRSTEAHAVPRATEVAHMARASTLPFPGGANDCTSTTTTIIDYLVRLAPGASIAATLSNGYEAARLSGSANNQVIVEAQTSGGAMVSAAALEAEPGIEQAAPVLAQSANPTLRSCSYDLSTSSTDIGLKADARSAFLAAGDASSAQLSDAPMWLVSDDPYDVTNVIVTAEVAGPALTVAGPTGMTVRSVVPHTAIVDPATGAVLGTAVGAATR